MVAVAPDPSLTLSPQSTRAGRVGRSDPAAASRRGAVDRDRTAGVDARLQLAGPTSFPAPTSCKLGNFGIVVIQSRRAKKDALGQGVRADSPERVAPHDGRCELNRPGRPRSGRATRDREAHLPAPLPHSSATIAAKLDPYHAASITGARFPTEPPQDGENPAFAGQ